LRNFQHWIVRPGEPTTVDTDISCIPFAFFDDEIVREEDVDRFRNTGL